MKKSLFVLLGAILLSSIVLADMPRYITVQGRLTDASDEPLSVSSADFIFRIFNVPSGGIAKWSEGPHTLSIDPNGLFNVELGRISSLDIATLSFDEPYYLEISVNTGAGWNNLGPRVNITSSGYAFASGRLLPTKYDILPAVDRNYNLGSSSYRWKNLYLGGQFGSTTDGRIYNVFRIDSSEGSDMWLGLMNATREVGLYDYANDRYVWRYNGTKGTFDVERNLSASANLFVGGKVGIGTTSPLTNLHVAGTSGLHLRSTAGSPEGGRISWFGDGTGWKLNLQARNDVGTLIGTNPVMTLVDSGNVGIGTTSPQKKMHIYAGSSGVSTWWTEKGVIIENDDNLILGLATPNNKYSALYFGDSDNAWRAGVGYDHGNNLDPAQSDIMWFQVVNEAKMVINSLGNVGIGTTSPAYKLDVAGAANAQQLCINGNCQSSWPSGGGGGWSVSSYVYNDTVNARVGIGTSNPGAALHINNKPTTTNTKSGLNVETETSGNAYGVNSSANTSTAGIGGRSIGVYGKATGLSTSLIAQGVMGSASGTANNYGVNGVANGGTNAYGLYGSASGATNNWGLYVAGGNAYISGNVSIGTTVPTDYKLDVNGDPAIATPYIKSPSVGDINKDGSIDFHDLGLVITAIPCAQGAACWNEIIGADNLGNYIRKKDANLNPLDVPVVVDIKDLVIVIDNYQELITPYTYDPKSGDINKDGLVNSEDLIFLIESYGCADTKPGCDPTPPGGCWDCVIGGDNLGNYIRQKNADWSGDGKVDLSDLVLLIGNYVNYRYLTSESWGSYPAAQFNGDTVITNAGFLKIERTSAGAPPLGDCDNLPEEEFGRFVIDTTNNRLYICMGAAGWKYTQLQP